jgi:hypothetical protein
MSSAGTQSSLESVGSTVDSSWASLCNIGGITAIIAAIFAVVWAIVPIDVNSLPYTGSTYSYFLTFVWQNATLYNLWYASEVLTVVFAIPVVLALYLVLSRVDKGVALIGTFTLIIGGLDYLFNVGQHFSLVQAAVTYNGGCTVCAQQALTEAMATSSVSSSDTMAGYLVLAGVIVLSLMMFWSRRTGKVPFYLGLLFAVYSVVNAAVFSPQSGNLYYDLGQLPLVLFALWIAVVGLKIYKAGSGTPGGSGFAVDVKPAT